MKILDKFNVFSLIKLVKSQKGRSINIKTQNSNNIYCFSFVLSFETGTLTCNIMNFKCLYVDGKSYGSLKTEANSAVKSLNPSSADANPVTNVNFQDE